MSEEVPEIQVLAGHLMVFLLGPFFLRASLGERWDRPDWTMFTVSLGGCLCWGAVGLLVLETLGLGVGI